MEGVSNDDNKRGSAHRLEFLCKYKRGRQEKHRDSARIRDGMDDTGVRVPQLTLVSWERRTNCFQWLDGKGTKYHHASPLTHRRSVRIVWVVNGRPLTWVKLCWVVDRAQHDVKLVISYY